MPADSGAGVARKRNVLVVDDDKLIRWALERQLAAMNCVTRAVETGADAVEALQSRTYDLVFLDVHLPDVDGLELTVEVERFSPDAAIVVMTADGSEDSRERALAAGARYLEKPFDGAVLRQVLAETAP